MKFLTEFTRLAPNQVFISIALGVIAGVCYSGLIPLVMLGVRPNSNLLETVTPEVTQFLTFEVSQFEIATVYALACVGVLVLRSVSEIILMRVANSVAKKIRWSFYKCISSAALSEIERIGSPRLIAAINIDVPNIVTGGRLLPSVLVNLITVLGILSFLFILNEQAFKLVVYAIFFGAIFYQVPLWFASRILTKIRETQDVLQEAIRGLIYGAKELKLDIHKRNYYHDKVILEQEKSILRNSNKGAVILSSATSLGDLTCFFVIGLIGFVFINYHPISQQDLLTVIMVLLFITGPISILLNSMPTLSLASISYRKFTSLIESMKIELYEEEVYENLSWDSITYKDVEYNYPSVGGEPGFKVGPINLTMNKGEVIFMVGANGSGKSTFSKLLTLYYTPTSGNIYFGDSLVDSRSIVSHRLAITAIYTDYYLFDILLQELDKEALNQVIYYIDKLGLAKKVKLEDGKFSTIELSDGQRKRLALLVSFIEDKQFYLFDEWAADQDPTFKHVFYHEILKVLRDNGKLVVVISHDEQYFEVADRLIVMENGKLKEREINIKMSNKHSHEIQQYLMEGNSRNGT
jgi:putative ATP-binding cassette transporter